MHELYFMKSESNLTLNLGPNHSQLWTKMLLNLRPTWHSTWGQHLNLRLRLKHLVNWSMMLSLGLRVKVPIGKSPYDISISKCETFGLRSRAISQSHVRFQKFTFTFLKLYCSNLFVQKCSNKHKQCSQCWHKKTTTHSN